MGNAKNCIFGGRCHECGRCEKFGLDARKEQMTLLPESFLNALPKSSKEGYGLAFDIGTTTVVGLLWDLSDNKIVDVLSRTNPQSAYGQDVISRINFCMEDARGLEILNTLIIKCLNDIIDQLCGKIRRKSLTSVVAVGNTTMCHLLLSQNPVSLARAPFQPAYSGSVKRRGAEIGLEVPGDALLWVLPCIAGHVGSDITAGIIANDLLEQEDTTLYIDIGTNGEIVLASGGKLFACSAAAGPAFEGASIRCGMRAAPGAVEKVEIRDSEVICETISNTPACGICGSGLIDAVAQMLDQHIIDYKGRMLKPREAAEKLPASLANRLCDTPNGPAFFLTENIYLCQQDIREVQLAKGAILAGATLLMQAAGKTSDDLQCILIAGAFGNYIDITSALKIGLFPPVEAKKIRNTGNSAGIGACMALLSKEAGSSAELVPGQTTHLNLSEYPGFELCYAQCMYFPNER